MLAAHRRGHFRSSCFRADVFVAFRQEASCLVLAFACIMRRTWRLIKRWVLPFLPGSSSFPGRRGGWGGGEVGGAGRGDAAGHLVPASVLWGWENSRYRGFRQTCRPVFLLFNFFIVPLPPLPSATGSLGSQGVFTARESESLDCEPENNRGKNGKLCQGLWGKNIDVSNKGPACIGERGLHVRPDCVAFTHREEMSAWYWPKFILQVWHTTWECF